MLETNPYAAPGASLETAPRPTRRTEYDVGRLKFGVLCVCTMGFYELYWHYQNGACIKQRERLNIWPFWRAIFAPLWGFALAPAVRRHAESMGLGSAVSRLEEAT
jgi:hypothetical protein